MTPRALSRLLPVTIQRTLPPEGAGADTPLSALLSAMSALHERPETAIASFHTTCDPWRTDDAFVPFLARWVNMDRLFPDRGAPHAHDPLGTGVGALRALVASAATLSRWRGTREGLVMLLETATGLGSFSIDEPSPERPFHLVVRAPPAAASCRALLEKIVDEERPAYCTWELLLDATAPEGGSE